MKNYKNYLIAVLSGLLALSLFTLPAQGAKAPASNPIKNTQYESCLSMSQFAGMQFMLQRDETELSNIKLYVSKAIFYCSPFKPANVNDAKTLEYKECLKLAPLLFHVYKVTPVENRDLSVFEGWTFEQVREIVKASHDMCKSYLPK
jgi:hypothetical protein